MMATAPYTLPLTLEDYLALPLDEEAGKEQEIIRGRLFVSPRPSLLHQVSATQLARVLAAHVLAQGGKEIQVILDVDLLMDAQLTYVSPDLMYFPPRAVPALKAIAQAHRRVHVAQARPALVVEFVSHGGRRRDLVEKRREYAAAGIPHYWAFDLARRVFVELVLDTRRKRYTEVTHLHGQVTPRLFAKDQPPFVVDLDELWLAEEE